MNRLFDRLGELLRGLRGEAAARAPAADPFLREAERELEEYLRTGRAPRRPDPGRPGLGGRGQGPVPEALRLDFANLGLEPSASFEQVRRARRQLLSRYHPDRFAQDPEKQRLATRITQILNNSFRHIRDFRQAAD
jgi:DnaJ-domain-containing protein 1